MLFIWFSIQIFWKNHEITKRIFVNWMKNLHKTFSCQRNDSIIDFFVLKSINLSWWKVKILLTKQLCRFSCSNFRHLINNRFFCSSKSINQSIVDFFLNFRHLFTNYLFLIIKLTNNYSKFQSKILNYVSFRFVCFNDLFVSIIFNKFVTTINEFVSMTFYERIRISISMKSLQ